MRYLFKKVQKKSKNKWANKVFPYNHIMKNKKNKHNNL